MIHFIMREIVADDRQQHVPEPGLEPGTTQLARVQDARSATLSLTSVGAIDQSRPAADERAA